MPEMHQSMLPVVPASLKTNVCPSVATVYEVAALQIDALYGARASSEGQRQLRRPNGIIISAEAVGPLFPPSTLRESAKKPQMKGKEKATELDGSVHEEINMQDITSSDAPHSAMRADCREPRQLAGFNSRLRSLALFPTPSSEVLEYHLPDSDFLKTIHHIAAKFFESRGSTFGIDHQFSHAKRKMKPYDIRRAQVREAERAQRQPLEQTGGSPTRPKGRRPGPLTQDLTREMTQAFDGRCLVALAIILEEDIRQRLGRVADATHFDEMDEADDVEYPWEPVNQRGSKAMGSDASSDDTSRG